MQLIQGVALSDRLACRLVSQLLLLVNHLSTAAEVAPLSFPAWRLWQDRVPGLTDPDQIPSQPPLGQPEQIKVFALCGVQGIFSEPFPVGSIQAGYGALPGHGSQYSAWRAQGDTHRGQPSYGLKDRFPCCIHTSPVRGPSLGSWMAPHWKAGDVQRRNKTFSARYFVLFFTSVRLQSCQCGHAPCSGGANGTPVELLLTPGLR